MRERYAAFIDASASERRAGRDRRPGARECQPDCRRGSAPRSRARTRYGLPAGAADQLRALVELLATDPHAPTTVRTPRGIVDDHLADSLVALELPEVRAASRDRRPRLGGRVPGLPLAIALPQARVSARREHRAASATSSSAPSRPAASANAEVVHARAEEWRAGIASCDVVTARALARARRRRRVRRAAARGSAGHSSRGAGAGPRRRGGRRAAAAVSVSRSARSSPVHPYPGARAPPSAPHVKVTATPDRFPRRPGGAQAPARRADVRGNTG